jgi:hypothetical protein
MLQYKREIKTFSKLSEFDTSRLALKKMLQEVLQEKQKNNTGQTFKCTKIKNEH